MLVGLSNKTRAKPKRQSPKRRKNKVSSRANRARRQYGPSFWYGPEFTREPLDAPCFLGPGRGPNSIYVLVDTRTGCVAYVGKTISVNGRFRGHHRTPHNSSLRRWQSELREQGCSPLMVVVDSAGDDWPEAERAWIAYYRRLGKLMNIERGG
jgi:hypothetical protein